MLHRVFWWTFSNYKIFEPFTYVCKYVQTQLVYIGTYQDSNATFSSNNDTLKKGLFRNSLSFKLLSSCQSWNRKTWTNTYTVGNNGNVELSNFAKSLHFITRDCTFVWAIAYSTSDKYQGFNCHFNHYLLFNVGSKETAHFPNLLQYVYFYFNHIQADTLWTLYGAKSLQTVKSAVKCLDVFWIPVMTPLIGFHLNIKCENTGTNNLALNCWYLQGNSIDKISLLT